MELLESLKAIGSSFFIFVIELRLDRKYLLNRNGGSPRFNRIVEFHVATNDLQSEEQQPLYSLQPQDDMHSFARI